MLVGPPGVTARARLEVSPSTEALETILERRVMDRLGL